MLISFNNFRRSKFLAGRTSHKFSTVIRKINLRVHPSDEMFQILGQWAAAPSRASPFFVTWADLNENLARLTYYASSSYY